MSIHGVCYDIGLSGNLDCLDTNWDLINHIECDFKSNVYGKNQCIKDYGIEFRNFLINFLFSYSSNIFDISIETSVNYL